MTLQSKLVLLHLKKDEGTLTRREEAFLRRHHDAYEHLKSRETEIITPPPITRQIRSTACVVVL